MTLFMPGRILDRHVGGNTTYARRLASGIASYGVEVESMPYASRAEVTLVRESLFGLKRRVGSVLHYTSDTGPVVPTRTPSIVTVHGIASHHISGVRTPLAETLWRWRVRSAIRCTDAVITVSQSSKEDISDVFGVPEERILVIPHGIDHEQFSKPVEPSLDVADAVTSPYLLYVGNIEPRKNLIELIHAVERLDLKLVIAGRPAWNYGAAMEAIQSSKNVVHLGFVTEVDKVALMQRCEAFVFPSNYEGFGFPVLEAMAAGAPVICSDRGSLAEVAGSVARIVKDTSADGIVDVLSNSLGNEHWIDQARSEGPKWAAEFRWESSVQRHLEAYIELGLAI